MKYNTLGTIGRFKPLHLGGAIMLEGICENSEKVIIGIGSSNRYDIRNPFTADESMDMINLYLSPRHSNYELIPIPDYGHIPEHQDGMKWKSNVIQLYNSLDAFVTGDSYVKELLSDTYNMIHPAELIPKEKWIQISGTIVRLAFVHGNDYSGLIPAEVKSYLEDNGLIQRFRDEFGLETLALFSDYNISDDSIETERENVHGTFR